MKRMKMIKFFTYSIVFLHLISCDKAGLIPDNIEIVQLAPDHITLHDIAIGEDGQAIIAGGDIWQQGVIFERKSAIESWTGKEMGNKALLCAYYDANRQRFIAAGIDGHIFVKEHEDNWSFIRNTNWEGIRSIKFHRDLGFGVGGGSFSKGIIFTFSLDKNILKIDTFQRELRDLHIFSNGQVLACGFGDIIKSADDTNTVWRNMHLNDNHFSSLSFSHDGLGFAAAYNGRLLKTTDQGESWTEIKAIGRINRSRESFNDVISQSPYLVVVGDGGLIRVSKDDGRSWSKIDAGISEDLQAVAIENKKALIVGNRGFFISFDL